MRPVNLLMSYVFLLTVMTTASNTEGDAKATSKRRGRGKNRWRGKWWGMANHVGPGAYHKEASFESPAAAPRPPATNALRPRNPQLASRNNHRGYPGRANSGYPYPYVGRESGSLYIDPATQPLNRKQRRLVKKNAGALWAVVKGAKLAISECKFQFRSRRWNCSTQHSGRGESVFGKILRSGCRETAFVYAITAGAVTHAVARGCSEGIVDTCTCEYDQAPSGPDWQWGGCSDNVKFGYRFSKEFVDAVEKGKDLRYLMNLHNNQAGRWHASNRALMRQECKCHGMSGSCTVKTCWMRLPNFRIVGARLKERFDGASRITTGNSGSLRSGNRVTTFQPFNPTHKIPQEKDLVYFDNSPNFCDRNPGRGLLGTKDRDCNATSLGVDGCDLMCCGRGFRTERLIVEERCNCTFHWCCEVKCDKCLHTKTLHKCL